MKTLRVVLVGFLIGFSSLMVQGQDIYLKLTTYSGPSPTDKAGEKVTAQDNGKPVDLSNYIRLSSVQYDFEQTLTISSQSTGAGAGKITFKPLVLTKVVDATSGPLFQAMASGTAYQFAEFIFVSSTTKVVNYKVLLKLAAVKTMAVSSVACNSGCPGIAESVSFEYGGYVVTTYAQKSDGSVVAANPIGWNRVRNVQDNNPTTPIQ